LPLTELMARAMHFYREQLKASPKAVDYLKNRGLTGEIAAKFALGYAPDGWQGLQQAFPDYNDQALVECGLVIVNEQGRRYDRFRDRVMFPILDQRGERDRLRRPRDRPGRTQIPELAGNAPVREGSRTLRPDPGAAGDPRHRHA
jgi:hypothetical protein